ncbi:MAG: tRNA uridine-5-carboxymethylaminomethyl(34) synthesis enzyme MnmG [Pseudomonadota bacterium]
MKHYDVAVIGGGHAGAEAADAAARRGARTALITPDLGRIGEMSCNPAIGCVGKGHLVREIDALGGVMGLAADAAGIQFRLLNRRKGPAVRGPRAQCDRQLYRIAVQRRLAAREGLDLIAGEAIDLDLDRVDRIVVRLADDTTFVAGAVVLTTGTFLRGCIHIGEESFSAGRIGEKASVRLADRIAEMDLPLGRLKTGTPPRLDGRSIDFSQTVSQPGDDAPELFSQLSEGVAVRQVDCHISRTTEQTHEVIRTNLHRSAVYGEQVVGVGPRYCPSIEDKVVRFEDRTSHQIFLEPEGLDDDTVYPNGISTSLPKEIQASFVATIPGLESVRILQPGYAIEYDFVDPRSLSIDLAAQVCARLFLAGQINGTTGYEEAAAQGLVAGTNAAALALGLPTLNLGRDQAYAGVLVDDLTRSGASEPYRMFTSRAEYRLMLRCDNADQRLTPLGRELGLVGDHRWEVFERKTSDLRHGKMQLERLTATATELRGAGISAAQDGCERSAWALMGRSDVDDAALEAVWPEVRSIGDAILEQLQIDARYAQYEERQRRDAESLRRSEAQPLPPDIDYSALSGLSGELREKLDAARPSNLGQASRIEGMTPAGLTLILIHSKRKRDAA